MRLLIWPLLLGLLLPPGAFPQASQQEALDRFRIDNFGVRGGQIGLPHYSDKDLGEVELLRRFPVPPTFTFDTLQTINHSDNIFFAEDNERKSAFWTGVFGITYVPYSTVRWTPRIRAEQYFFRYAQDARADFDAQILTASSALALNADRSLTWTPAVSVWRLTTPHGAGGEAYKHVQVQSRFAFGQNLGVPGTSVKFHAVHGYEFDWRVANPNRGSRFANNISSSLLYSPITTVSLQPFARLELRNYLNDHRGRDHFELHLQSGLSLSWRPIRYIQAFATLFWAKNYSSPAEFDYQVVIPALGLGAMASW